VVGAQNNQNEHLVIGVCVMRAHVHQSTFCERSGWNKVSKPTLSFGVKQIKVAGSNSSFIFLIKMHLQDHLQPCSRDWKACYNLSKGAKMEQSSHIEVKSI